jgi:phenylalanyl-tRNA synthetase beta chain
MHVSMEWLKEFVDIKDIDPVRYCDEMTMSGSKVESLEILGEEIENVVVGKIEKIESHPQADKLVICQVDVGKEILQIVTGADNIKEGDKVPVALPGAKLSGGLKIKKTKLRGVESTGMLCSAGELGMQTNLMPKEDAEGIYIFKDNYDIGADAKPLLGLDDIIVEYELTANRPDCHSIIGMARETSATFDRHLLIPVVEIDDNSGSERIEDKLSVEILNKQSCPRYVARMMKVNSMGPSPAWMAKRLLNCGIRPINVIVDVTNYVMLETGQPLHAFDYSKLGSDKIVVRNALKGEKTITLDGNERILDDDALVITNGEKPVAIAGIMGGENSEISEDTQMIVIESANFEKNSVRKTTKKLNFRTDSSTKFEKGIDPELAGFAADRAAQLLLELGACELINGKIDAYANKPKEKEIIIDAKWVNEFIGIGIEPGQMVEYLERLELKADLNGNTITVTVPTFRQDLEIKEDIAEEIARLYGYNKIPNTVISGTATEGGRSQSQKFENIVKNILVDKNLYEILTYSFTSKNKLMDMNLSEDDSLIKDSIELINPLGEENSLMRTTLLPGMLQVISHNYNRNLPKGAFFEIAVSYKKTDKKNSLPKENKNLSIGMYGNEDFFSMKGIVELILNKARIDMQRVEYIRSSLPLYHPNRSAAVLVEGEEIGCFGEVHPKVCKTYDLPGKTYCGELDFEKIFELSDNDIKFEELPKYPGIQRDLAFLAQEDLPARKIEDAIKSNGGSLLKEVELFDVYQGTQIQSGYKSMAYSLYFQANDRTLTDDEVRKAMDKILEKCKKELGISLRDA